MCHPYNDQVEESVFKKGYEQGYEDCMKEWLGFLRNEISKAEKFMGESVNNRDLYIGLYHRIEGMKYLIQERWHVEGDDVARGK